MFWQDFFIFFFKQSPSLLQLHHQTSWDFHSSWSFIELWSGIRWQVKLDRLHVTNDTLFIPLFLLLFWITDTGYFVSTASFRKMFSKTTSTGLLSLTCKFTHKCINGAESKWMSDCHWGDGLSFHLYPLSNVQQCRTFFWDRTALLVSEADKLSE